MVYKRENSGSIDSLMIELRKCATCKHDVCLQTIVRPDLQPLQERYAWIEDKDGFVSIYTTIGIFVESEKLGLEKPEKISKLDIYDDYMIFARKQGKLWDPPENFFAKYIHQNTSTLFVEMGQEYTFENLLKRELYKGVALPIWWCEGLVFSMIPLFYSNNKNEKRLDGDFLHVAIHFALLPKYKKSAKLGRISFEIIDVSKKESIKGLIKQIKIQRNAKI